MNKGEAGPWAMTAFRVMARLKFLRGTWLDPFRNSDERKLEQRLIAEFEADVADLIARLTPASHPAAVRVVGAYETIRGYGHVKEASAAEAARRGPTRCAELKAGKALGSTRRRRRPGGRSSMRGKTIVVTGGFGALGRVVAEVAAARGASVAVLDHRPSAAGGAGRAARAECAA